MVTKVSGPSPPPPAGGTFSVRQVARLFDLPEHRLRYWAQTGFITPSVRDGGRPAYSFSDLIAMKVAKELLDAGLPLQRVRRGLDALRVRLSQPGEPLARLRIRCDHDQIVVDDAEGTFEASSGQLLLDFRLDSLSRDMAQVLELPARPDRGDDEHRSAYDWFLEGCELEATDPQAAARAYGHAVERDPDLAAAWTNLGSLRADLGDLDGARDCFSEALRCDPDQPEAHVNLSELALREGEAELAIAGYRHVLRQHPDDVEAHYGLARALLAVGGRGQALAHLQRFCRACADSDDPEVARRVAAARALVAQLRGELGEA